jgi:hypothetical protein
MKRFLEYELYQVLIYLHADVSFMLNYCSSCKIAQLDAAMCDTRECATTSTPLLGKVESEQPRLYTTSAQRTRKAEQYGTSARPQGTQYLGNI